VVLVDIEVMEVRNQADDVVAAVMGGERVVLAVGGVPIADIVPRSGRTRWLDGPTLESELVTASADPALAAELDRLAGGKLDQVRTMRGTTVASAVPRE